MRLVLAEDLPQLRLRLKSMLSRLKDVEVVATTAGVNETVLAVRESSPDLLVLDLHLSDGTGFDVLRQIKSEQGAPTVLMLTMDPGDANRRHCLALGGEYFFDKATQLGEALLLVATLARGPNVIADAHRKFGHGTPVKH
jgi:two-component system, NarL family, response regulator DevR